MSSAKYISRIYSFKGNMNIHNKGYIYEGYPNDYPFDPYNTSPELRRFALSIMTVPIQQ